MYYYCERLTLLTIEKPSNRCKIVKCLINKNDRMPRTFFSLHEKIAANVSPTYYSVFFSSPCSTENRSVDRAKPKKSILRNSVILVSVRTGACKARDMVAACEW